MNEVDAPCLFNEVQQALNRASVLHHETFLRYRDELSQLEAKAKELTEKRSLYKLLSVQREGEIKSLQAELDMAQKEHADMLEQVKILEISDYELDTASNVQNPQVQQKIDRVDQLRAQMDEVKAMAEEWKAKMDRLASEKETSQEKLALAESQLRSMKEKIEARSQKIKELKSQLSSVVADRETFTKELKAASE
ncbi:uncharacterized protein [Nicotiana tomentosiformis]|uniref:uncharacterized protein n=1 Tax=Nicotiana tomentosiformis TaxID=4098 RepID=UPI00388C8E38